jgi:hypothetical protein
MKLARSLLYGEDPLVIVRMVQVIVGIAEKNADPEMLVIVDILLEEEDLMLRELAVIALFEYLDANDPDFDYFWLD